MHFINYSIVKFSVFLTFGILTSHFLSNSSYFFFYFGLGSLGLLVISWYIGKRQLLPSVFYGICIFCVFFCIGYINHQLRLPNFQPNHFSKTINRKASQPLQLKIKEVLKPDLYYLKYIAEAEALNGQTVAGKVLLFIQNDSCTAPFLIDDILLVYSSISKVPKSLNPYQFEYSNYLKTLGIYHQVKIKQHAILVRSKGSSTLRGLSEKIRNHIIKKLEKSSLRSDERSIVQALVLGQRNDITKEAYEAYAAAGAIHILAVSGLHVGILYLLLSGLLGTFKRLRYGNLIIGLLILFFLWGFALIAGLSPSVVRAVTMFSFFTLAKASQRTTNSVNTLFLSYFTLLLINPNWLFHVGFQLSYLAVFFILWMQPKLYQLYSPKNYLLKKLWSIFTVTVTAQLGIVPLSLFYFHQFPGLFLMTNLVVLPFLGILLIGGIIVVILATINALPNSISSSYNWLVEVLNTFIEWIAQQEAFLFEDIPFSEAKVLASYSVIISLILLWKKFGYIRLVSCLICIGCFVGVLLYEKIDHSNQQFVIFHKSRLTLMGYKNGGRLQLFKSDSISSQENKYPIKAYKVAQHITNITETKVPSYLTFRNKNILVLDSLGLYPTCAGIDIVIITQSPKIHFARMLETVQPKLVLADGSNYPSYVSRWKKTCEKRKLPFYHTGMKGAFILE